MINIYLIDSNRKTTVVGNVETELVYHLSCPNCNTEWSTSKFDIKQEYVFCPSCGIKYGVFVTNVKL